METYEVKERIEEFDKQWERKRLHVDPKTKALLDDIKMQNTSYNVAMQTLLTEEYKASEMKTPSQFMVIIQVFGTILFSLS